MVNIQNIKFFDIHSPQTLRFDKFFKRGSLIVVEVSLCCEISSIGGADVEREIFLRSLDNYRCKTFSEFPVDMVY